MIELTNYQGNSNGTFSLGVYNHDNGRIAGVYSTLYRDVQKVRMVDIRTRKTIDEMKGQKWAAFSPDEVRRFVEAATPAWLQIIELDN